MTQRIHLVRGGSEASSWGIWDATREKWLPDSMRGGVDDSPARYGSSEQAERAAKKWRDLNPDDTFVVQPIEGHGKEAHVREEGRVEGRQGQRDIDHHKTLVPTAAKLSKKVQGTVPKSVIVADQPAAKFSTYSPAGELVVVVLSVVNDRNIALDVYADERASQRYESISTFLFGPDGYTSRRVDVSDMAATIKDVWQMVDGHAAGWRDDNEDLEEGRHVADFNTLDDLLDHARGEGATHFLQIDDETHIYFRRSDGKYEKAEAWQKDGYWHTQAPGSRAVVPRPPRGARAIGQHAQGAAPKHFAAESNDANDVLEGLGYALQHEGHDPAREAARIARLIRGARSDRKVEEVLEEVNKLIGGHGVEAIRDENSWDNYYGDTVATYVNMGDTYVTTLLYDTRNNEFHITSWGDWYEKYEQERDAEREEEAPESDDEGNEDLSEHSTRNLRWSHDGVASGRYGEYRLFRTRNGWGVTLNNRQGLGDWATIDLAKKGAEKFDARENIARESPVVRDYIAVDRNDRRVAGPFRSQGEASQHVPPGGHVKFSSAQHRRPPPAPSSYPIFRERNKERPRSVRSGMRYRVQPEDLIPGNYVRVNGDVGRIMADLDLLSPVPDVERPEEWIAVNWLDGSATAVHLSDIDYAGRRRPKSNEDD